MAVSGATAAGRLVVCDDVGDPLTLDPHRQFAEKNHTLLQQIYEGLVRFDADARIEPALAESWERLDPLRMRFRLRAGVRFHNGDPLDAETVRFSIDRYFDPATGFPALGFIASIASATVVDARTVDIHTRYPDGLLLNRLAAFVLIVPQGPLRAQGPRALEAEPVGTGAFRFARWERGREIVLEANPAYWRQGRPKIAELRFRFLPPQAQLQALLSGAIHIATELPGTTTLEVAKATTTTLVKQRTFWTVGAAFNTSRPPLSDRRVRQALNFAVDKGELIRYDLLGNGRILASLSMEGQGGHAPGLRPYPFDPGRARALLQQAGFGDGLTLRALVRAQGERTARIIAKHWEAVGVKLRLEAVASDGEVIAALRDGDWDLALAGLPDPMAHLFFATSILLHSRSPFSLHRDAEFDRRLDGMAAELDPARREAAARALDALVHEQALGLFTYQRIKTYGVSRRVRFTPWVTGMPYFDAVEVSDAASQRGSRNGGGPE